MYEPNRDLSGEPVTAGDSPSRWPARGRRVCILAPALPPVIGGAESFAATVILGLAGSGVVTHVLTYSPPEDSLCAAIEAAGGSVQCLRADPPPEAVRWEYEAFYRSEALHRLVHDAGIELVHVFSHDTALAAAIAKVTKPSIPLVASFSEIATEFKQFGITRSQFIYQLSAIDAFLGHSRYYTNVALRHGAPPERVHLIYAGVETDRFRAASRVRGRSALGLPNDTLLVICPSRFSPRKRQLDLVAGAARLARRRRDFIVVLTGSVSSGSIAYYEQVMAAIRGSGLEGRVVSKTEIPRDLMPDVLASADVVVQPSELEGLGTAALEAMAAGVATVLTETHGFDEIAVRDQTSVLVRPGDVAGLADSINQLLDNPDVRNAMGRAAQQHVGRKFDSQRLIDEILGLYIELAAWTPN